VQVGVERLLHELADEFLDRALRADAGSSRAWSWSATRRRLLHADDDGRVDRLADVGGVEVLLEMIADGLDERLAEGGEVGPAHGRVLAVDERPVFLAVVVAVGERDLDVLALEVDDRVERLAAEFLGQEILQAVLGA
jgi:hypothetical protein